MISKFYSETPYSSATAETLKVWGDENLIYDNPSDNPYMIDVLALVPTYTGAFDQVLIDDSMGKTVVQGLLNDSQYKNYYFQPGDYRPVRGLTITASGTETVRKTISLYDPSNPNDNRHPAQMLESEQANFSLRLVGAEWWVIDRQSVLHENNGTYGVWFGDTIKDGDAPSSNIIMNRMHCDDFYVAIWIHDECHNNHIQSSRFDSMSMGSFESDETAIQIVQYGGGTHAYNNVITDCEFVDTKPGRLNRFGTGDCDFQGTVFSYNTIEYSESRRSDGAGNLDPTGDYYWGECSGFTTKYGAKFINGNIDLPTHPNPVTRTHNHLWGCRRVELTIDTEHGGLLSGHGGSFLSYYESPYVLTNDNVVFDNQGGVALSGVEAGYEDVQDYGNHHCHVKRNLIVESGSFPSASTWSVMLYNGYGAKVTDNSIIRPQGDTMRISGCYGLTAAGQIDVTDNVIVDPEGIINVFENSANYLNVSNNPEYATIELASAGEGRPVVDYSFITDRHTNTPRTITLPNVILPPNFGLA